MRHNKRRDSPPPAALTLTVGMEFTLLLSSGITGPFVHAKAASARVIAATEKAVRLRLEGDLCGRQGVAGECWFPRKAIVKGKHSPRLAAWFRPDGHTARVIDRIADGVISL